MPLVRIRKNGTKKQLNDDNVNGVFLQKLFIEFVIFYLKKSSQGLE